MADTIEMRTPLIDSIFVKYSLVQRELSDPKEL